MAQFTLAVWNMEWMNDLFTSGDGPATFKPDTTVVRGPKKTNTVLQRRQSLSGVLNTLNADVVVVVEGPNRATELQLFFDTDVSGQWQCDVQPTKGSSQVIGIAANTGSAVFSDPPFQRIDSSGGQGENRLSLACQDFAADVDDDGIEELHRFERLPLYLELALNDGTKCRVLGLHLKSKGIFDALEWSKWWSVADANRKKLLAQCGRLRQQFLDYYLTDDETKAIPLIVCGDINDGPGFDASERRILDSGIERLMGNVWKPSLGLANALYEALDEEKQWAIDLRSIYTTSFKDPIFDNYRKVWIDHILYTRNLDFPVATNAKVHIEMPGGEPMWSAFPHASDHFPIVATVKTTA